jgi:hypothetical protein
VGEDGQMRAVRRQTLQPRGGRAVPTADDTQLLADILAVCGDQHNEAAYRKAIREHPEQVMRMALAETRQAANEGRIGKIRGAFFFNTLQRLISLRA